MAEQIQEFMDETSALDPFQSSFRSGFSIERVLVAVVDDSILSPTLTLPTSSVSVLL